MTDADLAVVEAAKKDGSWDVYDAVEQLNIPSDLEAAFVENEAARQNFAAFSASNKDNYCGILRVPSALKRDKKGSLAWCTPQLRTKTRWRGPRTRSDSNCEDCGRGRPAPAGICEACLVTKYRVRSALAN